MADPVLLADGAIKLDPAGTGDVPSAGTSVDTMIVAVTTGDVGAAYAVGDPGLAASADSGGAAGASGARAGTLPAMGSSGSAGSASLSGGDQLPGATTSDSLGATSDGGALGSGLSGGGTPTLGAGEIAPVGGAAASGGRVATEGADSAAPGNQAPISDVSVNFGSGPSDFTGDAGASEGGNAAPTPNGGFLTVPGGAASISMITGGGSETALSGGSASTTTIDGGDSETVSGSAAGTATISGGGSETVVSGGSAGASLSPEVVTLSGSQLVFSNTYGPNVTSAYRSAIISAENYFQSHFTNSVTIALTFDTASGSFAGENFPLGFTVSDTTLKNTLEPLRKDVESVESVVIRYVVLITQGGTDVLTVIEGGNSATVQLDTLETVAAARDIRRLGVAVERLVLCDGDLSIEACHGHPGLSDGFHNDEATHRWTDGLGRLPEALLRPFTGAFALELYLAPSTLDHRVPAAERSDAAAASAHRLAGCRRATAERPPVAAVGCPRSAPATAPPYS